MDVFFQTDHIGFKHFNSFISDGQHGFRIIIYKGLFNVDVSGLLQFFYLDTDVTSPTINSIIGGGFISSLTQINVATKKEANVICQSLLM